VVKDNIALNNELDGVKKDNKALKTQISTLQDSVSTLVEENNKLAQQTNKQDENKDIVENIKPKLKIKKNEKSTVTNNNDASSGFSINAISDSESD
jgi:regulator of replication initiation timing